MKKNTFLLFSFFSVKIFDSSQSHYIYKYFLEQPYCLELTSKGWRITSLRSDCMQGDFTRMELFTNYYESLYHLLKVISPESITVLKSDSNNKLEQEEETGENSGMNTAIFFNNNYNEVSQNGNFKVNFHIIQNKKKMFFFKFYPLLHTLKFTYIFIAILFEICFYSNLTK